LDFLCVPKTVKTLRLIWAPEAFVVTFKLETDPSLLPRKAAVHYDGTPNTTLLQIFGSYM